MNRAARFLAMGLCAACATSFSLCAQTNAAAQSQARRARGPRDERGVYKARLVPHWFSADSKFWYRNDLRDGKKEFVLVDCEKGSRQAAFDHDKLAVALSKTAGQQFPADRLPFSSISFSDDAKTLKFDAAGKSWECDLENYSCKTTGEASAALLFDASFPDPAAAGLTPSYLASPYIDTEAEANSATETAQDDDHADEPRGRRSPDGKLTAFVRDNNLFLRAQDGSERQLSQDGATNHFYGLIQWAPDSSAVVAWRIEPAIIKEVFNIESSPPAGGRAILHRRPYAQAGDAFTHYEVNIFDPATGHEIKPDIDIFEQEWERPQLHWLPDNRRFAYVLDARGHQHYRVVAVDSHSGAVQNLVDEKTDTFIWTMHTEMLGLNYVNWLDASDEMIFVSERDGWRHLYLIDTKTGALKNQITKGQWVVRGIDRIDEDARQVWFRASGMNQVEDPYFIHYYRINFDGSGLTPLTEGDGNHSVQFSENRKWLIDTYSRVNLPPVHNLRRASDGSLVCELEKADISELLESGWKAPEVFVSKARDGQTDIWGIIHRPRDLDPAKQYPVLEDIYAGPQGAFVPKSFTGADREKPLCDRGFIVVQIDGMGTAFRSRAFHDVCWHNLKDAGLPDRILWHRAVAAKYPYYDLSRVGIFGTSAGGQSAAAALLFHGDFYKCAVANCGCHDNRLDKASWNEQWMGYPVGPQYSENSNIDNASRLTGNLFLIVGEMDGNVPPESTMRFADALIKAGKDFDLLVVPGADHGIGGPAFAYAQRRTQDFFVRHLLQHEPPDRNAASN